MSYLAAAWLHLLRSDPLLLLFLERPPILFFWNAVYGTRPEKIKRGRGVLS